MKQGHQTSKLLIALALPAVLVAGACAPGTNTQDLGAFTTAGAHPTGTPGPADHGRTQELRPPLALEASREVEASAYPRLRFQVTPLQSAYAPGEPVQVRVQVTNASDQPVSHILWSMNAPAVFAFVETPYGAAAMQVEGHEELAVQPAVASGVLQPGQSVEQVLTWDQTLPLEPHPAPAPGGTYTVVAHLYVGEVEEHESVTRVVARTQVDLVGQGTLITPQEAATIARGLDQVRAWLEANAGSAVVKEQDGQWYALFPQGWVPVPPEKAQALHTLEPGYTVLHLRGAWEVRFFSQMGAGPGELAVQVHDATGKVLNVQVHRWQPSEVGGGLEGTPRPTKVQPSHSTATPQGGATFPVPLPSTPGTGPVAYYLGAIARGSGEGQHLELREADGTAYVLLGSNALLEELAALVGRQVAVQGQLLNGASGSIHPAIQVTGLYPAPTITPTPTPRPVSVEQADAAHGATAPQP